MSTRAGSGRGNMRRRSKKAMEDWEGGGGRRVRTGRGTRRSSDMGRGGCRRKGMRKRRRSVWGRRVCLGSGS